MKNLANYICKEIADYSGFYDSFVYAYCAVNQYCAGHNYYLADKTFLYRMRSLGCNDREGNIDFEFRYRLQHGCTDCVSFEWFTTNSGKVKVTVRIVQKG